MINTPTDLVFPYKDPTVAYKFLSELTDSLRVAWDELRFGNSFARGYMGWTPSIDQMFLSTTCGPNVTTTSVQCLSLNGLVDDIVISAEKNIREKVGMSSSEKYAAVRRSYLASQLLSEKLSNTTSNFLSVSTGNCGLGFPTLALYIPVFFVMLILSVLLFNEMDTYLNINQQIRSMLLLIPPDASEAVPDIREYVNTLSTKMSILSFLSKNNKDNDKKTKAILEGSTDGVILCNSEGNIVEVNSAAQAMFSITQADVVGNNLSTLFSEDVTMLIREVSKTHKGTKKELHGKRKEDAQFPVRLSTSVGVWNNKTHVACFVTDCTIEQKQKELLDIEKKNNETLLLSILPSAVASRLKRGETCIADQLEDVTCFFSDMVGFTKMSSTMTATDLVTILNKIVVGLDDLCVANNLEKIKTIGDAYFCVGGLGNDPYHPEHTVRFGLQAIKCVRELSEGEISIRVGVHTGPVVAGVIGRNKFAYDCWGDSVNMASRMEVFI
jgi:PAS domain S-box-containing protein